MSPMKFTNILSSPSILGLTLPYSNLCFSLGLGFLPLLLCLLSCFFGACSLIYSSTLTHLWVLHQEVFQKESCLWFRNQAQYSLRPLNLTNSDSSLSVKQPINKYIIYNGRPRRITFQLCPYYLSLLELNLIMYRTCLEWNGSFMVLLFLSRHWLDFNFIKIREQFLSQDYEIGSSEIYCGIK